MVKRKCGTCRHFKDGGIAGSGWCQHPARRALQHMVLVRKTELACRNGLDQDLWVAAESAALSPSTVPDISPQILPVMTGAPHDSYQLRSPDTDLALNSNDLYTDKVKSISMPVRPTIPARPLAQALSAQSASEQTDESSAAEPQVNAPRSLVREARRRRLEQRNSEKRRYYEVVLREAGDLLDGQPAPDTRGAIANEDPKSPADAGDIAAARSAGVAEPQSPKPAPERLRHGARGDAIPRAGSGIPAPVVEFSASIPRFTEPPRERVGAVPDPEPVDARPSSSTVDRAPSGERAASSRSREYAARHDTEPLPTREVVAALRADDSPRQPTRPAHESRESAGPLGSERWLRGVEPPQSSVEIPAPTTTGRTGVSMGPPVALPVDPLDEAKRLSSVPRCCGSCRDFRRVSDGPRGWCMNPYAFPERRMVQSDELACRSTIGVWWLPHDDLWLERADTTHHGRPTPLLDELMRTSASGTRDTGSRHS